MYNILIVDDEEIICSSLKARLEKILGNGFNSIHEAYNGIDAIKLAEKTNLDIVITDIKMPKMDGIELIREMKRRNLSRNFLVISGYDDYEYVREAFRSGIVDYLLKPVSIRDLEEKLDGIYKTLKPNRDEPVYNNSDTIHYKNDEPA
ncbi:MAG TPA: response regulator, partial [Gallicola sp.]|nr:response regulator [Gallicola sp.]